MKLLKAVIVIFVLFIGKTSNGQISIPADSIKNFLCHKWGFKAIIMGGQRLTNMNESVTYDFFSDGTLKRTSSKGKQEKGTWTIQAELNIILLKIKKSSLHIPTLSADELIVSIGDGRKSEANTLSMGTVLKRIE